MVSDNQPTAEHVTAEQIRILAAAAGLSLDEERAATLAPQADQHFARLRAIAQLDARGAEPAAEWRLDALREAGDA